jgi:hypothetical protein
MSTHAPSSPRPPGQDPTDANPDAKPAKFELSLSQTLGGALAAMTAAALGSRLGVGGTIIGAAVASIIAGVAGAFYTHSLRAGREKVKTVWTGRIAGSDTKAAVDVVPNTPVWDSPEAAAETRVLPTIPPLQSQTRPSEVRQPTPGRTMPWKGMLVGALAVFAIAVGGLTGFELLSGSALSGGQGTTIQQVAKEPRPAAKPSSDDSSESPSPSPSESESESETPTPTPSASEQPTETPAPDVPSAEPTTGEEPPVDEEPTTPAPSETATTDAPSAAPTPSAGAPGGETPAG